MPIPAENPIVTIPVSTPFDADDRVDFDALAFNLDRWSQTPLAGFIIGTASDVFSCLRISTDREVLVHLNKLG